ncbi:MAG: 2-oxoacid:acceptor oxidoreductase subunit alpha, partial [Myxococcales bacterium]|nr:2-oxoacid:acceptor oxidoreductase subunit alpha [Myxococcales bacterium]
MSKASDAVETVETVAIRFAGDSGDGMQLTGTQFTQTSALAGNDLATFPDFPAEIRAPAGSLAGVSGFQLNFSSREVFTHGDAPDVLVAMNPAALRVNLPDLKPGGILIANTQAFSDKNLERAGYSENPLEDGSLSAYKVYPVDITTMTLNAIADVGLNQRAAVRSKNFFALGLVYWLFNRDLAHTERWIEAKFRAKTPEVADANLHALRAGYNYGETAELFDHSYMVRKASIPAGRYRNITGNEALGLGMLAAAELSGLELFLGSYPITPASDILHFLSKQKHLGVKTFQAEDEIAAVAAAVGAAFAGGLALTTTSGPGIALKGEAMGLAMMLELPLIVVNVQRGGPSTGLPTKTEQSDLLQALFGRNGECPMPVVAAMSPGDCFETAIEAVRIAVRHMVPVVLLSDGYLANGAEPWKVPEMAALEPIPVEFHTQVEGFQPYNRDENLARPWAVPGTPGLEHRVGGL